MSTPVSEDPAASLGDRAFALLQSLLPKHLLSSWVYRLMRSRKPWLRKLTLDFFLSSYRIDMSQAVETNPYAYASFNAFFTRALKPDARPIAVEPDAIVSPVDGTVSQCGVIDGDMIIQAKGHRYSLLTLLAGNAALAQRYKGGHFACIYLAPYNYHRMHMPLAATVRDTIYVPGELFSVNTATARSVPSLFARNERVICDFESAQVGLIGTHADSTKFTMVFVGALFVGSIETVWAGEINPLPRRLRQPITFTQGRGTQLHKGAEAGRFNMGSTVVMVFERDHVQWDTIMRSGAQVRMGQRIGTLRPAGIDINA
jgi:phosphatidylserine decarboxylase